MPFVDENWKNQYLKATMRKLFLLLLLFSSVAVAQNPFYENLAFGKYNIAFHDTLIYNTNAEYESYGYKGPAPLFVQVWFPTDKSNTHMPMTFGELADQRIPKNLRRMFFQLSLHQDTSMFWLIEENMESGDQISYGDLRTEDILHHLKDLPTSSFRMPFPKILEFPVVIYGHGAQSLGEENYVLAEYLASHGYVFISCNNHLPHERGPYGMSHVKGIDTTTTKTLVRFARGLCPGQKFSLMGHSMGAQRIWAFVHEPDWAKAFVSLETTLEFYEKEKTDTLWPELSKVMNEHHLDYHVPTLMMANDGHQKDFDFVFFDRIANAKLIQAISKKEIDHEAYTSIALMRFLLKEDFPQPDEIYLQDQFQAYIRHLRLSKDFLDKEIKGEKLELEQYKEDFYIKVKN